MNHKLHSHPNQNQKQADKDFNSCTLAHKITFKNLLTFSMPIVTAFYPSIALAESVKGISSGMWPLIKMIQDFALPVGIGVSIWGMVEWMLDNPKGKERVKVAVICYIGIFVIPYIFLAIRNSFQGMTTELQP